MKSYLTINEGFIDAISNRVKTNVNNAADAVGTAMGYVNNFGKKISDTSNSIADGAKNVSRFINGDRTPSKKENPDKTIVNKKPHYVEEDDDDDEDYQNEGTMLTTSLIKRQIPNGKQNTLKPVQNVKPVKMVNNSPGAITNEHMARFATSLQKQATNSGFTLKSLIHDFPKKLQPPKDQREADIRHLIKTGQLPERDDQDDYDRNSRRR